MVQSLLRLIGIVATVAAIAGMAFYVLCIWSAAAFLRHRRTASQGGNASTPSGGEFAPISILKPLKGVDPEIYESLRSHCLQDYPQYEIIFGVAQEDDPALPVVKRLQQEFPNRAIQLVVCSQNLGSNTKVSNLAQMVGSAHFDLLIVNDSDIHVEPDYLRRVVAPLRNGGVGMVTCLYRGVAAKTLGSALESVGISTDFAGGVLVARYIEGGMRFGLGSTLAFRRKELEAIGGFGAIVDYLADDYELGRRIADLGLTVWLSEVVVETFLPAYNLHAFFEHQLRWARSVRDSRKWGYVGVLLTFGLPWAALALATSRGASWAWCVLGGGAVLRLLVAIFVGSFVLRDPQVPRCALLIPMRDMVALFVWAVSFVSNTIRWRGTSFRLKDGKLVRMSL
jgi:ceramide glucosyltransferase